MKMFNSFRGVNLQVMLELVCRILYVETTYYLNLFKNMKLNYGMRKDIEIGHIPFI